MAPVQLSFYNFEMKAWGFHKDRVVLLFFQTWSKITKKKKTR